MATVARLRRAAATQAPRPSHGARRKYRQSVARLTPRAFADLVGDQALAERIMLACGGQQIPVLTDAQRERVERDERIRKAIDRGGRGYTYEDAAAEFGLSSRQVRRRVNGESHRRVGRGVDPPAAPRRRN